MNQPNQPPQYPNPTLDGYQPNQQAQPVNPQWEQPQSIPNQLPPTQMQPQPTGVQAPAPAPSMQEIYAIRPPEANSSSFVPDVKTKEILERTYPEMVNALVNLAIKKFSEDTDYAAYFVREEFKQLAEASQEQAKPKKDKEATPAVKTGADFSSW